MLLKVVDTTSTPSSPRPPSPTSPTCYSPHFTTTAAETEFRDIPIHEGEMFLLPPNTPHNPVRFADTVGIVIEQPRPEGAMDRLRWYCPGCGKVVHEVGFRCEDLGRQVKEVVEGFAAAAEEQRRCGACGVVVDVLPPREEGDGAGVGS